MTIPRIDRARVTLSEDLEVGLVDKAQAVVLSGNRFRIAEKAAL